MARVYDQIQEKFPEIYPHNQNDQRAAEIAGNAAGIEVGKQIWSYLTGHRNADVLERELTQTLCVPDGAP